jgi:tRNA-2-methylthio-N6-dimethylallyladenosine synthase
VQRLAVKHGLERSDRYLGRDVEVLVEGRNKKVTKEEECMGKTRQGRQVFFEGDVDELVGTLVMVKIEEARPWSLRGTLVSVKK